MQRVILNSKLIPIKIPVINIIRITDPFGELLNIISIIKDAANIIAYICML